MSPETRGHLWPSPPKHVGQLILTRFVQEPLAASALPTLHLSPLLPTYLSPIATGALGMEFTDPAGASTMDFEDELQARILEYSTMTLDVRNRKRPQDCPLNLVEELFHEWPVYAPRT